MCVSARIEGKDVLCYALSTGELDFRDEKFQSVTLPSHVETVEVQDGLVWQQVTLNRLTSLVQTRMVESLAGLKKLSML